MRWVYIGQLIDNDVVFLRCIEYYRGILFLTTNRVGHFDDAFVSRIHVIIYYDKLGLDDRKRIWKQFFDKLNDERVDFLVTKRAKSYIFDDEIMCQMEWNGREIRNGTSSLRSKAALQATNAFLRIAFQTAVALAEFRYLEDPNKTDEDCPTLDQRDFEEVGNMMRQFKDYLVGVHGADEHGRAFLGRARRDDRNDSALAGQER